MEWEEALAQHEKMVQYIVNQFYTPTGLERADLEQVALMGLWKACELYKPYYKNKFSTYAYTIIRNEVMQLLRKNSKFEPERTQSYVGKRTKAYIEDETMDKLLVEDLTRDEQLIVHYLYLGYTQREIAKMLDSTQPAICKRIRNLRIRAKQKWGS